MRRRIIMRDRAMRKIGLVASHEYLTNLKRRSFLFAAFGIPVFVIVVMLVVFAVVSNEGDPTSLGKVGYIDQVVSWQMPSTNRRFRHVRTGRCRPYRPGKWRSGAYFVLPPEYMFSGTVKLTSSASTPESLETAIDDFLLANLMTQINADVPADRLRAPVNMTVLSRTADGN